MHNKTLTILSPLAALGAALLLLSACGGDEEGPNAAPGCAQDAQCPSAQVCRAGACVAAPDPDMDQGEDAADAQVDLPEDMITPDLPPDDLTPEDMGPEEVTEDLVDMGSPDLPPDLPEDLPADVEADMVVEPDAADLDEPDMDAPDLPLEPRPEVLEGGLSLYEANIRINFVIGPRLADIGAAFVAPQPPPTPGEPIGPCALVTVDPTAAPAPFGYDAGTIEIQVAERDLARTTPALREDGAWVYGSPFEGQDVTVDDVFDPGDTITVRSRGGRHVRGFEASITAPPEHQLTSPAPATRIGAGALDLSWTGPNSGQEVVVTVAPLNNNYTPIQGMGLNCPVEGDPGSLQIPAEAMGRLGSPPRLMILVVKVQNQPLVAGEDNFILNTTLAAGNIVDFQP